MKASKLLRFLITSDWHMDARTAGRPRFDEWVAHSELLIDIVKRREVDVVAFLGDAHDPGQGLGPLYAAELIRAALALTEAARLGSIWVAGNHDVVERYPVTTTLSPLVAVAEAYCDFYDGQRFLWVSEHPETADVSGVKLLLLPYVSRTAWRAGVTSAAALEEAANRDPGTPLVVLAHMTVPGAVQGSESQEMSRGRDVDLPDLAALAPALVANGHYHRHQVVRRDGVDVVIPGSPLRNTFGEAADQHKGCVIAEVQVVQK